MFLRGDSNTDARNNLFKCAHQSHSVETYFKASLLFSSSTVAKLSSNSSFSWAELAIFSANPATHPPNHPPDRTSTFQA